MTINSNKIVVRLVKDACNNTISVQTLSFPGIIPSKKNGSQIQLSYTIIITADVSLMCPTPDRARLLKNKWYTSVIRHSMRIDDAMLGQPSRMTRVEMRCHAPKIQIGR